MNSSAASRNERWKRGSGSTSRNMGVTHRDPGRGWTRRGLPRCRGCRGQPSGVQTFLATSRPSPTGSSTGSSESCSRDGAAQLADRHGLGVALGRVGHPVVPQRVVERHDPARTEQPQRLVEVGAVLQLVAVGEDQVVVAVGEPGEDLERVPGDQPHPLRGDAGLGEGLLGEPLVLRLGVDGGEDAVGAHAAEHPDAGHAGAGADLDDGAGLGHRGQEAQRGAAARRRSARRRPPWRERVR